MNNIYRKISESIDSELSEDEVREFCQGSPKSEFWLFEHTAHVPESRIVYFDNIQKMEKYLLSESGILNAFTTYSVAIANGAVCDYTVIRHEENRTIAFDKEEQLSSQDPFADNKHQWHVRWSNA